MRCKLNIFIYLFLALFSPLGNAGENCESIRAAFDIGSGATKVKVAKVNFCEKTIVEKLGEFQEAVAYKDALMSSLEKKFSAEIMKAGLEKTKGLIDQATRLGAQEFYGVATSAFRDAKNADEMISRMDQELKLKVKVISQKEEALLGFNAASLLFKDNAKNIVVWDIGGGSQQMTSLDKNGDHLIFEGQLASASFKNLVIEKIQGKNSQSTPSPNPLSPEDVAKGLNEASEFAKSLPTSLKEKIKTKEALVVGIGGVHSFSLLGQIRPLDGKKSYTLNELEKTLKDRTGLTDKEIGGDFSSTEITNLVLVQGMMTELGMSSVSVAKINMADGLLVNPEFVEQKMKSKK